MHQARLTRFVSMRILAPCSAVSTLMLLACGRPSHVFETQNAEALHIRRSQYQQGLRIMNEGLRDERMVGDDTARKRRWRLQWDPGRCTYPKGPTLDIKTNLNTFDAANAYWLSWLSIQAYRRLEASEQLQKMGLTKVDFIDNQSTSFQAFVGSNDKYVIVSFAGTSDVVDYLTDLTFASKPEFYPGIPGRVHIGFVNVLEKSWQNLLDYIVKHDGAHKPIILTGHSLGGAQAVLSATRLAVLGFPVDSLYIYSVPRVGDETYARFVSRLFPNKIFRFVNHEDIVPRLPPPRVAAQQFSMMFPEESRDPVKAVFETLNYTHVGQMLIQNARGELSEPRDFSETEDIEYWKTVIERSRGRSLPAVVFANWRMLFDHIPFASHCQLKAPPLSVAGNVFDFRN